MKNTPICFAILSAGFGIMGAILYVGRTPVEAGGPIFMLASILFMVAAIISVISADKKQ